MLHMDRFAHLIFPVAVLLLSNSRFKPVIPHINAELEFFSPV